MVTSAPEDAVIRDPGIRKSTRQSSEYRSGDSRPHIIFQFPDPLDQAGHGIARFQEAGRIHSHADAGRRTGGDDRACLQRHSLGEDCDNISDPGDQAFRI